MDKESMLQAAEEEWLSLRKWQEVDGVNVEECNWPWFWLILAESIWPSLSDKAIELAAAHDLMEWLISGE